MNEVVLYLPACNVVLYFRDFLERVFESRVLCNHVKVFPLVKLIEQTSPQNDQYMTGTNLSSYSHLPCSHFTANEVFLST